MKSKESGESCVINRETPSQSSNELITDIWDCS